MLDPVLDVQDTALFTATLQLNTKQQATDQIWQNVASSAEKSGAAADRKAPFEGEEDWGCSTGRRDSSAAENSPGKTLQGSTKKLLYFP